MTYRAAIAAKKYLISNHIIYFHFLTEWWCMHSNLLAYDGAFGPFDDLTYPPLWNYNIQQNYCGNSYAQPVHWCCIVAYGLRILILMHTSFISSLKIVYINHFKLCMDFVQTTFHIVHGNLHINQVKSVYPLATWVQNEKLKDCITWVSFYLQ